MSFSLHIFLQIIEFLTKCGILIIQSTQTFQMLLRMMIRHKAVMLIHKGIEAFHSPKIPGTAHIKDQPALQDPK